MKATIAIVILAIMSGCASTAARNHDAMILESARDYFHACRSTAERDSETCSDVNREYVQGMKEAAALRMKQRAAIAHRDAQQQQRITSMEHMQRLNHPAPRTHAEMMCAANPFEC